MSTSPDSANDTEHYRQVLRSLVDMANEMAQLNHQQTSREAEAAKAAPSQPAPPDLNRRRPRKPTLPPQHDTAATILAEYASLRHDTG